RIMIYLTLKLVLFFCFWFYIIFHGSHYVIAYMYAVFLLNLVLRFITPLSFDDLVAAHEDANRGTILPLGEFKPFLRQMNEFTFWLSAVRVTYIASFCLTLDVLDIDVYWPLLILYFVILFLSTMNQQIKNMIKYRYVPFNFCKFYYYLFIFAKKSYGFKMKNDSISVFVMN
uniref:Protein RER1 n=1 Tax=Bos mutus grunniens TaxID=30521 RepID=A0A8B9Y1P4_BOSMU